MLRLACEPQTYFRSSLLKKITSDVFSWWVKLIRDGPLEKLWGWGGGGGGAEFSSSVNFFFLMFPLNDLFFCQDDVHEYFFPLK